MLSVTYWSLSGFDSVSTFAGEVDSPHTTFPRALTLGVLLMAVCYVLPLGVAAGVDDEWACWKDGSLARVARLVGGGALGLAVLLSATASNWGLYASELLEDSFQVRASFQTSPVHVS